MLIIINDYNDEIDQLLIILFFIKLNFSNYVHNKKNMINFTTIIEILQLIKLYLLIGPNILLSN
jgi:hypothetical protein